MLLRHARERSALLRRRYAGLPASGVDLTDLPPLGKPELMSEFDAWVTDPEVTRAAVESFTADPDRAGEPMRGGYFVCRSSGTTGEPGLYVHDRTAMRAYQAISRRVDGAWLSGSGWLSMARHRMRWVAVVGTGGHYAGQAWMAWQGHRDALRGRWYHVLPVEKPLPDLVAALNDLDPAVLTSYPSALDLLARERVAGRLRIDPVIVEAAGETVTPDLRARVASGFGVPLREAYSASECPVMAFSCDQDWLHVNSDWVILEPVEADATPTQPGRTSHTVLLTNLANKVQPFIRYDLGDAVMARPDRCTCGSPLPAIRVQGRTGALLDLPGLEGSSVRLPSLAVASILDQTPGARGTQLLQVSSRVLRLRVQPEPGHDAEAVFGDARQRLQAFFDSQGASAVVIDLDPVPPQRDPGSGKLQQVVLKRPNSP